MVSMKYLKIWKASKQLLQSKMLFFNSRQKSIPANIQEMLFRKIGLFAKLFQIGAFSRKN